jgi:hypothetical protein
MVRITATSALPPGLPAAEGIEIQKQLAGSSSVKQWHRMGRRIIALHRARRQAEALTCYQAVKDLLSNDLGIDPGRELNSATVRIINGYEHPLFQGVPVKKLRTRLFATVVASVTILTIFSAGAAQASPKDKDAPATAQNCTLQVQTRATQCFRTLTEAVYHVTRGRVANAPADAGKLASDKNMTDKLNAPAARLVLGVFYYWENFGQAPAHDSNPTLVVWSDTGEPCSDPTSDMDYAVSPLPNFTSTGGRNWNNNIRSAKVFNVEHPAGVFNFNHCYAKLYDLPNFGGTATGYLSGTSDLGTMRDRAESIQFS